MAFRSIEVLEDWSRPNTRSNPVRTLKVTARLEAGADIRDGGTYFAIYDAPAPEGADSTDSSGTGRGGWFGVEVAARTEE